jgi:hypothetical protein
MSLTGSYRSCISTKGTSDPRRPRAVQGVNQKEEDPEPPCKEKPSLRMSFARIIDNQVEELLEGMLKWRKFGPAMYLLEKRSTQSFLEDCTIS